MPRLQFLVTLDVANEIEFRRAAQNRLLEQGVDPHDAAGYADEASTSLDTCAMVLLHPRSSPEGSSILWSDAIKIHS